MANLISALDTLLSNSNISIPRKESEYLLSSLLNCRKIDLYLKEDKLNKKEKEKYLLMARKRRKGVPLQLLLGKTQFMDWTFSLQKGVFIPRPETEILVEEAARVIKNKLKKRQIKILDLGTGSGVIAISLLKIFPQLEAYATDISLQAINLARRNAKNLGVENNIHLRRGNLFSALKRGDRSSKFFLIISNPPYIPEKDLPNLPKEVRDFDPPDSLSGGKDGLEVFDNILAQAGSYLEKRGYLLLELGKGQGGKLREKITGNEKFEFIKLV